MEIPTLTDFERLELKVSRTEALLNDLVSLMGDPILNINDIAKRQGNARTMYYRKPWLLPNYGRSEFSDGRRRWRLRTFLTWIEKSAEEREREWLQLPLQEKQRIQIRS